MAINSPLMTPTKTSSQKSRRQHQPSIIQDTQPKTMEPSLSTSDPFRSRFEAYNRLQAAVVAFGEKLPIPEIVAIGGQSDGKSSLLEALLGFRFNVREVEMGTRRPLILQMVHDPSALEPRCRFQEEDSDDYGTPISSSVAIAEVIKSRTDALLKNDRTAVSSKPIVMRTEYAHCPNLTIIDTPGFVLKAKKGEPENTPDEILSMVKALAGPPHRLILFLQQSSVEWCSSLWLDAVRSIDPTLRRTIVVVSKFDNRLKEFSDRWEVDGYLSASGYLGENTHPFFVALPKDRGTISNEEFRRQISHVDKEIIHHLRENVNGGFDEEKYGPFVGFGCLRNFLESELQKRFKEAAPATLALLEQRCSEVASELARAEMKLRATSDVSSLRKMAMLHAASICRHVWALIEGAADPAPEEWGKTTDEERHESALGGWPGVTGDAKPPNSVLKLYGGAAFERVMHEFQCATYSIECPTISMEKVANILFAHAGRGGGGGVAGAATEIARTAARSWLAPLLDTACDRLAFVLKNLFDLAAERNRSHESLDDERWKGSMDGYVGFHAALRHSYYQFIHDLAKQCKQLVRHHLDSVTSPYSQICYYSGDSFGSSGFNGATPFHRFNFSSSSVLSGFDISCRSVKESSTMIDEQENMPPNGHSAHQKTPGKTSEKEILKESQLTVPETPSPDQPGDGGKKKDLGVHGEMGMRKRQMRTTSNNGGSGGGMDLLYHGNGNLFGCANPNASKSSSGSVYAEVCSEASKHFARIREILIERSVPSTLNAGFLTPCRDKLVVALGLELFAVNDERFMDMFVSPGAVDMLTNEMKSLQKRQKTFQSCLNEFKSVARAL